MTEAVEGMGGATKYQVGEIETLSVLVEPQEPDETTFLQVDDLRVHVLMAQGD